MERRKARGRVPLLVLPVAISVVLLAFIYLEAGLFPFGRNTLVWGDFASQVVPLLAQFKRVLQGDMGALFSLQNAGGMNFVGVFLYFLASPFTLLVGLVPEGYYNEFANLLVLIKVVCAAVTATLFFASPRAPFKVGRNTAGVLGVAYAFSGFTMLYYQNNVWLDAVYLLPLLGIALLGLAQAGRVLPFSLALAAVVVCQFQLAYTVVLALLVLGAVYVWRFAPKHEGAVFAARLGVGAVLGLLLSAAAWLPALLAYTKSARSGGLLDSFENGKFFAHMQTTLPVLLCSCAIVAALVWLLWQRGWRRPKVRFVLVGFGLLCVPLVAEPVNLVWHGGSYQSFPSRFGFITVLLGLMLVAAAAEWLRQIPTKRVGSIGASVVFSTGISLFIGVVLYIWLFHREEADAYTRSLWGSKESLFWAAVACLVGAAALLAVLALRGRYKLTREMVAAALCCVVVVQGAFSGVLYMGSPARDSDNQHEVFMLAGQMPHEDDSRVKTSRNYTEANTIGALGYPSLAHYSSFTREDTLSAYKKLGYSGYWMELSGFGGTMLSDYFLNVGGVITLADGVDPMYDESAVVYQQGWYNLQTQDAGGYATLTSTPPEVLQTMPEGDRFYTQNWLYWNLYGGTNAALLQQYEADYTEGVYFQPYDGLDQYGVWLATDGVPGQLVYTIEVTEPETLYFDCFRYISNSLEEVVNYALGVRVNGVELEGMYPNPGANGIICLGSFENETVEIRIDVWRSVLCRSFGVAGIRHSDFEQVVTGANTVDVQIDGSRATAQVNAPAAGGTLVLAIGYDEGFRATVNGEKAEVYKVLDGYMAVRLQPGENTVVLRYFPPGLAAGLALSGGGVILALGLWFWRRRNPAGRALADGQLRGVKIARAALLFVGGLAFFIVYILPLGVWLDKGYHGPRQNL